jgi:hypothetical protein
MIQLQLYIEGEQVELHDNESVTLTQSLQDVLDLQKIFTDFSRTFNVPASKVNNKIFKHFYNPSIQGFDARSKKESELYLNYKPFKSGKIKLENVQMKNNSPINYRITFFGKTIELKDILGKDKLSDLTNITTILLYQPSTIKSRMQTGYQVSVGDTTVQEAVIYPIVTHTNRLVYNSTDDTAATYNISTNGVNNHGLPVNELKPAVRIHLLIKAIEDRYGLKFSTDFFNTNNPAYYNLYLWLSKQKGKLEQEDGNRPALMYITTTSQGGDIELQRGFQEEAYYNKGRYFGDRIITISVQATAGTEYSLKVTSNGAYEDPFFESEQTATGANDIIISQADRLVLVPPTANQGTGRGNPHRISIISNTAATFTMTQSVIEFSGAVNIKQATRVGTYTQNVNYRTTVVNEMPDIGILDFLTGLFKAFNLTAFYDNDTINILPLDSFYASSTETFDVTEHIDTTTSEVSSVLPYNRIAFEYEGNETFFSAFHKQIFGSKWGSISEIVEDVPEGEDYIVKLPFEHHKFEKLLDSGGSETPSVQWGWSVNQDQEAHLGKPFLFYGHKIASGTPINVLDSPNGTKDALTTYFIPSNLADPTTATSQSIHFGQEKNEFTNTNANNSLFNTYYKKYITESVNSSRRLFKFTAFLPLNIILNIKLQDKVVIFNDLYKINKIVTNFENGKTELELLNEVINFEVEFDEVVGNLIKTADSTLATVDSIRTTADAGETTI